MKYEYKTESGFSFDDLERRLNEEGRDSWELVSTIGWGTNSFTAIFKRTIKNVILGAVGRKIRVFGEQRAILESRIHWKAQHEHGTGDDVHRHLQCTQGCGGF